jgi:hypothetical protein
MSEKTLATLHKRLQPLAWIAGGRVRRQQDIVTQVLQDSEVSSVLSHRRERGGAGRCLQGDGTLVHRHLQKIQRRL